jgi:hypothetical protein
MSILKTLGLRWFAFSLLSILMAFNGVGLLVQIFKFYLNGAPRSIRLYFLTIRLAQPIFSNISSRTHGVPPLSSV